MKGTRRWVIGIGIVAAVVVIGVGAYLFQPWRLFTTTVVAETLPPVSTPTTEPSEPSSPSGTPTPEPSPAEPIDLATGSLISHEHATSGSVRVIQQPDGTRVLLIEGLNTSDGPDLRVWLSDQPVIEGVDGWYVFDDGQYLELGPLRGNVGDLVYPIPDTADLETLRSVSIWCARFAVSFGAAALTDA